MIDLSTPLSLASSFRFPLQSPESRREIAWGAVLSSPACGYSDPYNAARIPAARVSPVVPGDILFMM